VGKEYSKSGAWKRDPLHNLSHGATALQVARFYYMLQTGQLVSPEHSRQMKDILADPAIKHKFVKGLESKDPDHRIYRKSGTWRQYHSDSAIIEHGGRRYIAVALAKSPLGGKWLSDLIVVMDDLITKSASN
jgi:beta-lactamase class A